MASERRIPIPPARQILERVRRGGKRTVVAGVLVLILVFMWLRVFLGHGPAGATAAPRASAAATDAPPKTTSVQRIELPRIPGRNDSIQRDFFTMKDRSLFRRQAAGGGTGTGTEVTVTSSQDVPEVIQRVARTMKLEAVLWNESPRIYINDRLLEIGDRCVVKNGAQSYEFEVLQIYVDSVLVECAGVQLTLKLAQRRDTVP
jgi:hypothetical protein